MPSLVFTLLCIASLGIPAGMSLIFATGKLVEYRESTNRGSRTRAAIETVAGLFLLSGCLAFMVSFYGAYANTSLEMTGVVTGIALISVGSLFIGSVFIGDKLSAFDAL